MNNIIVDSMINKILNYCEFEEGKCYILMLIPRKKENLTNTEKNKLNLIKRKIIQTEADVIDAIDYFNEFCNKYPEIKFRIYVSVNKRDMVKAFFEIQHKMLTINNELYNGNSQIFNKLSKLDSLYKSTLCEPKSRAQKRFLFDVDWNNLKKDTEVLFNDYCNEVANLTTIISSGKTLNGFYIITEPFNIKLLQPYNSVEVKTDAELYIGVFNYDY